MQLNFRKAEKSDLEKIIELLISDKLGKTREKTDAESLKKYTTAFDKISTDENQFLAVLESEQKIIGTCHLTIMPSLTYVGSDRLAIEAVRIDDDYLNQGLGSWMIEQAIEFGKNRGIKIFQLTSNKKRQRAINFYKKLGFEETHEGMKLML